MPWGAVEKGHISLRKAAKYWNIPLISFSNHFNHKTKTGKAQGVLTKKEDATIITWLLKM
jgi:predicted HTH domain antitoxin